MGHQAAFTARIRWRRPDSRPGIAEFGIGLEDFERDLRAVLREASPDNRFAERLPATEIKIWRKPHRER